MAESTTKKSDGKKSESKNSDGKKAPKGERSSKRGGRVKWAKLCADSDYRGMWVALHGVTYESGVPLEGNLVDAHEDLGELCARIQLGDRRGCAVLFCDDKSSGIRRAT